MPRLTLTGSSLVTIAAVAVAGIAVAGAVPPLLQALTVAPPADVALAERFDRFAERHAELAEVDRSRFDGRSLFFTPKPPPGWSPPRRPPPPPPPRPVVRDEPEDTAPPEPRAPRPVVYDGPGIVGVDGRSIYFKDGSRVAIGETDEDLGVAVVSIGGSPPMIAITYKDTEFELPLFEGWGDTSRFFNGSTTIDGGSSPVGFSPIESSPSRNRAMPDRNAARDAARRRAAERAGRDAERND